MQWERPSIAVAASRTFQQLGRLCGAAHGRRRVFRPTPVGPATTVPQRLAEPPAPARTKAAAERPGHF
ncbi:hypothetical protein [Streptomyces ruber]|nr:hypothetical protein [Streptomyces ruber]